MFRRCSFFINDTATTEIYPLSLHDALPIYAAVGVLVRLGHLLRRVVEREDSRPDLRDVSVRDAERLAVVADRKSTRLNSSHANISYAVFCLNKKTHLGRILLSRHYICTVLT